MAAPLPAGPYDVILADPPWGYRKYRMRINGAAAAHYATMKVDEIKAMPVAAMSASRAVLYLWATWPKLDAAFEVIRAWGFEYKTGLPWVKTYDGKRPVFGVGFWFRGATEPLLVAVRGKVPAPPRGSRIGLLLERDEVLLAAPRGRHSEKPADVYDYAEETTAHLGTRRLELFARAARPGWDRWGLEAPADDGEVQTAAP